MKLLILSALLLPAASAAEAPGTRGAPPAQPAAAPAPTNEMPNLLSEGSARCRPIAHQIAAETKRLRRDDAHTLNREPMGHLLFAVDRRVDGCREVTFARGTGAPPQFRGRNRAAKRAADAGPGSATRRAAP